MSLIGKISTGNYENCLKIKRNKLEEDFKKAILHNIWAYLYYNYAGSRLEKDKPMCEAIHIISSAYNRKY